MGSFSINRLKRFVISVFTVCGISYFGVVLYMYFMQDQYIFLPEKNMHELTFYKENNDLKDATDLYIKTKDHETLEVWMRPPNPGMPMVLYIHGNSHGLDYRANRLKILSDEGYGFFIPALRGYANSSGRPSLEGFIIDTNAALEKLYELGYVDRQIIIIGESLGSGLATKLATEHKFKALILLTPYTTTMNRAKEIYPLIPVSILFKYNFDNISYISKVQSPVFIIHGTNDEVIPHAHSEALIAAAIEPKKLVLYNNYGHSDYDFMKVLSDFKKFMANPEQE